MKACKNIWGGLLTLFFALVYLLPLNGRLLWQPDETRYAEISREMLQRGDWVVPNLLGLRYFEKPVAGYWLNNISQWLFGDSNFAVRFASVFSTGITALLVFSLGWLMWRNIRRASLATLIFMSMVLVFSIGTYSVLDPMIALWLTAAMASYYLTLQATTIKGKLGGYLLLGLACGMGFMTKGFLALAVPVIAVLPIAIMQRRWRELLIYGPLAIVTAALLSLPWALAIAEREPDFWHYFFWIEHIQRFAEDNAQHKAPFWYYLPVLMAGVLPWLALLPGALLKGWRERARRPELLFLLSWVVMPLIFFSIAKGKLPTYILPCMAPLALLMAAYAEDAVAALHHRVFRINALLNGAFGLLGIGALLAIGLGLLPRLHLFSQQEWPKIILGIIAFTGWLLFAVVSVRDGTRRWSWAAACPLLLCLLIGYTIPQQVIDSKQPQNFIRANQDVLAHSRYVLSDSVGLAAGLAWQLKRSDVLMYSEKGEVSYGLDYQDARSRFVSDADFPQWLAQARRQGNVSLVLQLSRGESVPANLPPADQLQLMNRFALLWYQQQP
ncbi:lipid IV(A) 4-amino-4-deoxy-L-arabinosyltransferase [Serratia odorifera]|uniref:Undecaprenyl phosphate-alpha-4-amino-4-deoxy-L-arabinose arabinosyl transferase n=1 Tax=Serratia odorifera DSM 4582 TaxID=667129 RepID=D4E717_SEROD|nr:lipid IV(A) 4-amino-4-deoxy-L-arabinosyltransferase [Serratia odorifera]EFE94393.1 dolichyl-phosphate-mannose-protein mannosyltransferase [Serratia odorifera DSM 4582]MBJ2065110.1 lipid IV(A) 4-amino-4-deoxy-L-arabinosyltransferase [Serratia odorifera]PNK89238.1 lipid IV(A) 4-amino-4-deoxy-L-arabinosyltransferase [Serratia odorifera]RII70210.1 lipid IV(A) 4-amino-4-deoxy-L-arabinosyltransferase [Serratia odorifera]HEJ9094773.1 lipid IV(A) 4-amino-4-deoxy-L-arabinosyltransferase [Serratia od